MVLELRVARLMQRCSLHPDPCKVRPQSQSRSRNGAERLKVPERVEATKTDRIPRARVASQGEEAKEMAELSILRVGMVVEAAALALVAVEARAISTGATKAERWVSRCLRGV